jgi:hypothetical protein
MALKGIIEGDHIPNNKFELNIIGLPAIVFTKVSGLESEIAAIELPDRTMATGGQRGATELVVEVPNHHSVEIAAMETWLSEGVDPVSPTYKKVGTLVQVSNTGNIRRGWAITGVWITKRKMSDMEMSDAGEMSVMEYTLKVDDVTPLPGL